MEKMMVYLLNGMRMGRKRRKEQKKVGIKKVIVSIYLNGMRMGRKN